MKGLLLFLALTQARAHHPGGISGDASTGASFLEIPVGGRPAGLGGAYTASALDAYGAVWNPAGLPHAGSVQAVATRLLYIEGTHYDHVGLALPTGGRLGFGLGAQVFRVGTIPASDVSGNPLGAADAATFGAYSLAAGAALSSRVSVGVAAKLITGSIAGVGASSFAGDAGLMYRRERLTLGAAVANLGPPMRYLAQEDPLPSNVRLAAAYSPVEGVTAAAEAVRWRFGEVHLRGGVEWRVLSGLALRSGYRDGAEGWLGRLSAGLGLGLLGQQLDYAWLPAGDLGSTHYLSLLFSFGQGGPARSAGGASRPKTIAPATSP